MTQDEKPPASDAPEPADPAEGAAQAPIRRILEEAETAGQAFKMLAQAYPGQPPADILAALEEHTAALRGKMAEINEEAAAVERLSVVLEELVRRMRHGGPDESEPSA